jgi:hypothetical protein
MNIIIIGTGDTAKIAYTYYGGENVICFIDTQNIRIGSNLMGKKVLPFEDLKKISLRGSQAVIATRRLIYEIISKLLKYNFTNFII